MHRVGVPEGSKARVLEVPEGIAAAQEKGGAYDPRRFNPGTPDEVLRGTERAWNVAPTSKRIVDNIPALARVLSKITEYKWFVIPGEMLCRGCRAVKWGLLKRA